MPEYRIIDTVPRDGDWAAKPNEMPTLKEEQARYRRAWAMLDRASVSFWLSLVVTPVVTLAVGWLVLYITGSDIGYFIALFGWLVLRVALGWGRAYDRFECPRCHQFFFHGLLRSSDVSGRCVNCKLPRGALPPDFEAEV